MAGLCARRGEDPGDVTDGEVINHGEEVEKVELPQRERGSRRGGGGRPSEENNRGYHHFS